MQISDLKAQNLLAKNAYTSIYNLQSAIINHEETGNVEGWYSRLGKSIPDQL
jgi:hypothetical protein